MGNRDRRLAGDRTFRGEDEHRGVLRGLLKVPICVDGAERALDAGLALPDLDAVCQTLRLHVLVELQPHLRGIDVDARRVRGDGGLQVDVDVGVFGRNLHPVGPVFLVALGRKVDLPAAGQHVPAVLAALVGGLGVDLIVFRRFIPDEGLLFGAVDRVAELVARVVLIVDGCGHALESVGGDARVDVARRVVDAAGKCPCC